ncbi:MAG: hydroxymethylbilane synthase [Gammaproteobacteria bacterium]
MTTLRIATRQSPLALWQAEHVRDALKKAHPDIDVELLPMSTRGDEILDKSLAKIGGKGLFIKELEVAMLEGRADLAVHSMKDVPVELPEGMTLAAILEREEPTDAFVSNKYASFSELPQGAVLGTSSLRRQAQLLNKRPDLDVRPVRGNVGTRLSKLDSGEFDAIILASAGLIRLELTERIAEKLDVRLCMPAAGQGAVGIECLASATRTQELVGALAHEVTTARVTAERAVTHTLEGSCTSPIAVYATHKDGIIQLGARVAAPSGEEMLETVARGDAADAHALGIQAGASLKKMGAAQYLKQED